MSPKEYDRIDIRLDRLNEKIDNLTSLVARGEGREVLCDVMQERMTAVEGAVRKQNIIAGTIAAFVTSIGLTISWLLKGN